MYHLDKDLVSQMCLGLTCSYFYKVFHFVHDPVMREGMYYAIRTYRMDLRMQISSCGNYSFYGWGEYCYLNDISWHRSLGEFVCDEKWLWGDLLYCEGCGKCKPKTAFGEFEAEEQMLEKESTMLVEDYWNWHGMWCRRCRAKVLLMTFENRREVWETREHPFEIVSLGVNYVQEEGEDSDWRMVLDPFRETSTEEEKEAFRKGYESWDTIFVRLDI